MRVIRIIILLLNIFKTVYLKPKFNFFIPSSFICGFVFHLEVEPRSQNISITYSQWLLNVILLNTITTSKKKKSALSICSKCIFDGCFCIFVIDFFFPLPSVTQLDKSYIVVIINGDIKSIRNWLGIIKLRFWVRF